MSSNPSQVLYILVLNMGSTSTQVAIFKNESLIYEEKHETSEATVNKTIQLQERKNHVNTCLEKSGFKHTNFAAIVSRGGLIKPLPAGIYTIDEKMSQDLMEDKYGRHPSAFGPIIALELSKSYNCPAYTIDPPSTDELSKIARISGSPMIKRSSAFHALSQKAAAKKAAAKLKLNYHEANLIVAHLGGGITIGAHSEGKVIDVNNALSEGPFTPERSGSLPVMELIDYIFILLGEKCLEKDKSAQLKSLIKEKFVGQGGVYGYLGTKNMEEIEEKNLEGSTEASFIIEGMSYQVAKEVGSMATVLGGNIDSIVLTGALINAKQFIDSLTTKIDFLAKIMIISENEMQALAQGALRALTGAEKPRDYNPSLH